MRFCICGDFAPKKVNTGFAFHDDEHTKKLLNGELENMFEEIREELAKSDVNMVNVETTLLTEGIPIVKNGALIVDHPKWAEHLFKGGFNVALTANNHIGDYGEKGTLETLRVLRAAGLQTVGSGENEEAAGKILYIEKNGERMAIINACEHEYGLAKEAYAGAMHAEPFALISKIKEAKRKADFIVVVLHGGCEHIAIPSPRIKNLLRGLAENGADMVVNNHQHCPMAYEIWQGVPIFYSMGNFVFDFTENNGMWNYGYMISAEWKNGKIGFEIVPYFYGNGKINRFEGEKKEYFFKYIKTLQKFSFDEKICREIWLTWCFMNGEFFDGVARKDIHFRKNSYNCEAHCEVLSTYYEEIIENEYSVDEKYKSLITKIMNYQIADI
ncbi:MAG: CapA family protein [Clostridia bacterium]|nr:CapA family protein [Clostridia bacterium]